MKLLSMQADDHQEQPFRVDPLLPEQMCGEFNKGQLRYLNIYFLQVWKIFNILTDSIEEIPLNLLLLFSEQPTILQGFQEVCPDILFITLVRKHFFCPNTFHLDRMQLPSEALVSQIFHQMEFY